MKNRPNLPFVYLSTYGTDLHMLYIELCISEIIDLAVTNNQGFAS